MRKLKIANGDSRTAVKWSNKEVAFDELCARFETTKRTSETVAEYKKMTKAQKGAVKDVGGFTCCHLREGRRKRENVVGLSMIKLDGDAVKPDFLAEFERTNKYECVVYSTHSHTPEEPRLRIIIPAARDMTTDEANAVGRYIAAELSIDQFDPCSYIPHQLMYHPSTPADGEYIYRRFDGDWLDPDKILAAHPDWRDCTLLPTSSKESAAVSPSGKRQEDPLAKNGVVGAFCRAYAIDATIDTFLSDVYEATATNGRYTYLKGESSGGLVLYEGKFAYSHHATDPACGKECNAFDLVRIHKFGDLDEKKSFKAMCEFAVTLDEVKVQIAEEREAQAAADFTADTEDWRTLLKYQPRSSLLENSVWNEWLILTNDPDFSGFAYNELAHQIQITGKAPWERPDGNPFWRDSDTAQLKAILDIRYLAFSSRNHDVAFTKVADDRRFHPIRDYLDALPPWDGVPRLDALYIDYLGADDTPYTRAVTRKTHVAAVARVKRPGIKFDSVPVLVGAQGIGKSTLIARLGREWYSDSLSIADMKDKTAPEKLQGNWLLELSEMAGIRKMDVETVKSFASRTDDKYRPSYGRVVENHPRQCVIIGTTNSDGGFLRDVTGNRRFWPVKVAGGGVKRPWDLTEAEVGQIWAEAVAYFEGGEELYLTGEVADIAAEEQRGAMETDEREGLVREYLNRLLPTDWNTRNTYKRREYISEPDDPTQPKGTIVRTEVSNAEIWCECFGKSLSELKPADSYALAAIMMKIDGWERSKAKKRIAWYGEQRLYIRSVVASDEVVVADGESEELWDF